MKTSIGKQKKPGDTSTLSDKTFDQLTRGDLLIGKFNNSQYLVLGREDMFLVNIWDFKNKKSSLMNFSQYQVYFSK